MSVTDSASLQFRSRNYKHEVVLENPRVARQPRNVVWRYSDAFLERFFQEVAARHFNGFVVYCHYHPFEYFLDYEGFPHATDLPADLRRRNLEGLRRLFGAARRHGLRTFLHHYATHFTRALADHLKLGVSESGDRLARVEHPVIEEYNRYIYRRTFDTLPELDGLYMNFESSGNAAAYMRKTLIRVANAMTHKPALFFRLWGVSDVEGTAALVRGYHGPKAVIHKGHDTSDFYFYPVADDRVKVWKKAMPEVEFLFSLGPCHNCGTNVSRKLWTDPEYIHALLRDMQSKGADSISFQSSSELLLDLLPDNGIFSREQIEHARMNRGHLEAVVDYVRGEAPSRRVWANRYASWFKTSHETGEAVRRAITESSQIILKQYRQFCAGSSQEGYMYPFRHSYYQEPFFYYPMSFANRFGEIRPNVMWREWAVRDRPIQVVPNDTEAIIDFVNPGIRHHPGNNPLALARQIRRHIASSREAISRYGRLAARGANPALIGKVSLNCINGERIWREILIARELYACYFVSSRSEMFAHLRKARDLMRESARVLGDRLADTDLFWPFSSKDAYDPAGDADALDRILRFEKEDVPDIALMHYLRSHAQYNEIRRLCRPYVSVRGAMLRRNRALLTRSQEQAEKCLKQLAAPEHAIYRDNAQVWRDYIRAEIDWLTPPAMLCPPDGRQASDEGFREMLHEQDYRWGEECWWDFASFYRRHDFFRDGHCACRATHTPQRLKVSLRERDCKWAEREMLWNPAHKRFAYPHFMQIFIDPKNTGSRAIHYNIFSGGKTGGVRTLEELPNGSLRDGLPAPIRDCDIRLEHTDTSWRCDVTIPWRQLGGRPHPGETWRLNVIANPAVARNTYYSFCKGFEQWSDVGRLGRIIFAD